MGWMNTLWPALLILAVLWAANQLREKLEAIEHLLIDINNHISNHLDPPENLD
jgi:hypothetical protein